MRWLPLCLTVLLLAACSSTPTDEADDGGAETLYNQARSDLVQEYYSEAVAGYEELLSQYPFGVYATQAQLDIIHAYAEMGEPESAIAAAKRFIDLNPRHEDVPYAYYMRGVVEQTKGQGLITRWVGLDRARRDPEPLEKAFNAFQSLIKRYPDSDYIEDARTRMGQIRETLARHDLQVAQYYRDQAAWVAAANRAKRVITRYPGTDAIDDALQLLSRAYGELDRETLRNDIRKVLKANNIPIPS